MNCPECGKDTMVVDSRSTDDSVRRRRECNEGHRFSTQEWVIKSNVETRANELLRLTRLNPGANYKDLSEMMKISKSHVVKLVNELVCRKLLVKSVQSVSVYPAEEMI